LLTSPFAPFEQGEIGPDLFRKACEFGLEGLVSKRLDRAGASPNWLKAKNPEHPAMQRVKEAVEAKRPVPVVPKERSGNVGRGFRITTGSASTGQPVPKSSQNANFLERTANVSDVKEQVVGSPTI
jgi:hypothetical protein